MATCGDLIAAALKDIGVLAAGETSTAEEAEDARLALNRLLDQWAAEKLTIHAVTRTTATLTANQASFTVGPGGNINIVRPVFFEKVKYIDTSTSPTTEHSLGEPLTEEAWAAVPQKALTGTLPSAVYYSPTFPLGTLYPLPIPTSATLQWAVYHWAAVTSFAALTTTVSLPPAYERALVKNLALEILPSYPGRQLDQLLLKQAQDSFTVLKRSNTRLSDLSFDRGALVGGGGGYSIYTDS